MPAEQAPAPRAQHARWIVAAIVLIAIALGTAVVGARDFLERRRVLARAYRAIAAQDLGELEASERELDELYETRLERLPPRRDGIVNELGSARGRVREAIARLRGAAAVDSSTRSR
jgi:hypothetical protein